MYSDQMCNATTPAHPFAAEAESDEDRRNDAFSRRDARLWLAMAVSLGIMFGLQAALPEVASLLFLDEFASIMQVVLIASPLLPGVCLMGYFSYQYLRAGGSAIRCIGAFVCDAIVFAVAYLVVETHREGLGAAMAAVAGGIVCIAVLVRLVYNDLPLSHYLKSLGPFCIAGILMYCIMRLAALVLANPSAPSAGTIAAEVAIGIAFYVVAVWYWSAKTGCAEAALLFGRAGTLPSRLSTISLTDKHIASLEREHFAIRRWLEDSYSGPMSEPWLGVLDERRRRIVASGLTYASYACWLFFTILYQSFFARYLPIYGITIACFVLLFLAEMIAVGRDMRLLATNIVVWAFAIFMMVMFPYSIAWGGTVVIFAFYARNYSLDDIARFSLIVTVLSAFVVVVSARGGIIDSYIEHSSRTRHLLGFLAPLYPSMHMFVITLLTVYLSKRNLGFTKAIALTIPNVFLLVYTGSRMSFVLSLVVVCVSLFVSYIDRSGKRGPLRAQLCVPLFFVCMLVSILLAVAYDPSNEAWASFDTLFGWRFTRAHDGLMTYGITVFGQDVAAAGNGLNPYGICETVVNDYIDNAYIKLLVRWGIVWTIVYAALWTVSMLYACRQDDPFLAMCLAMIALHCLIHDMSLLLSFNPFFLIAGIAMRNMVGCGGVMRR